MTAQRLTNPQYLLSTLAVTAVNLLLVVFIINALAQSSGVIPADQTTLKTKVVEQSDSPLTISVFNVDASNRDFQAIRFQIQNIGPKSARGYVIFGSGSGSGKLITNFFPSKSFPPGAVNNEEIIIERSNIMSGEDFSISIDYVEFDDGSWWGTDAQSGSNILAGKREGALAAIDLLENLIDVRQSSALSDFRRKKLAELDVPLPADLSGKDFRWQEGFRSGYKGIIGLLKNELVKGQSELRLKLASARGVLNTRRRVE